MKTIILVMFINQYKNRLFFIFILLFYLCLFFIHIILIIIFYFILYFIFYFLFYFYFFYFLFTFLWSLPIELRSCLTKLRLPSLLNGPSIKLLINWTIFSLLEKSQEHLSTQNFITKSYRLLFYGNAHGTYRYKLDFELVVEVQLWIDLRPSLWVMERGIFV